MNMNKKKIIIIGLVVVIVVAGIISLLTRGSLIGTFSQEVSMEEPVDVVMGFYSPWFKAVNSTSTDPYTEGLVDYPILSKDVRTYITENRGDIRQSQMDPVLCQSAAIPSRLTSRKIYEEADSAQVLIMAKDKELSNQAVATLLKHNEGWYINSIECTLGEVPPEREFSFEREGKIIKASVPDPYNKDYWHVVYEENGQEGLLAPLFFNEESKCIPKRGDEYVCDPNQLKEDAKVVVKAQLTEWGAEVKRLEFK